MSAFTPSLSQLLQLKSKKTVAVVGAGGKTSTINLLAQQNQESSVFISPTTKIYLPQKSNEPYSRLFTNEEDCLVAQAEKGITYGGILNSSTQKLSSFSLISLAKICQKYDFNFLEADGSRALPCKGWKENEPVIPDFVTDTIGVITVNALHKPANEDTVLNLPLFLRLTGLQKNEPITIDALTQMVVSSSGMFKSSIPFPKQKLHLIINQVENGETQKSAFLLAKKVESRCTFPLQCIIMGSTHKNNWQLL